MPQPGSSPRDDDSEITRVSQDLAYRLRQRGVAVRDDESPEDIVNLLEGVEAFEQAVMSKGGDLMVDEPPRPRKRSARRSRLPAPEARGR